MRFNSEKLFSIVAALGISASTAPARSAGFGQCEAFSDGPGLEAKISREGQTHSVCNSRYCAAVNGQIGNLVGEALRAVEPSPIRVIGKSLSPLSLRAITQDLADSPRGSALSKISVPQARRLDFDDFTRAGPLAAHGVEYVSKLSQFAILIRFDGEPLVVRRWDSLGRDAIAMSDVSTLFPREAYTYQRLRANAEVRGFTLRYPSRKGWKSLRRGRSEMNYSRCYRRESAATKSNILSSFILIRFMITAVGLRT